MTTYYARKDYTYEGGDAIFSIPFTYIKKSYINVLINDELTEQYTYLNSSQIQITTTLNNRDVVSIRRTTPIDEKLVVFSDTSILSKDVQNLAQDQVFDVVQEIYDNNITFGQIASNALDVANNALSTAETAETNSTNAVNLANLANGKSNDAVSTANNAESLANSAVNTANAASLTASNAATTANSASDKVDSFGEDIETVIEAADKINELEAAIEQAKEYAEIAGNGFGLKPFTLGEWVLNNSIYELSITAPIVLGVCDEEKNIVSNINIKMTNNGSLLQSNIAFNGYVLVSAKNVESEDDNPISDDELDSYEIVDWDSIT